MKHWKRLTRALLITALMLGAAWTFWPAAGEAADTNTGYGETWELTSAAQQQTADGNCDMGTLDTCRELCLFGEPTGQFGCFAF